MEGLATELDFPAAEKTYSHVSYRRPSDSSSADTPDASPTDDAPHGPAFVTEKEVEVLRPAITQESRPPLTRNATSTSRNSLSRDITRFTTHGTTYTSDPSFEVDFEIDDPNDPRNWPTRKKALLIFVISFSTLVVVVYSTSYTATLEPMMRDLHVNSQAIATLGITTYLVGLAVGSLLLAPISETYGRRPVYIVALSLFTILVIPCALAKDITTIIVVRFFGALTGSATIANAPGSVGDIVSDEYRALAFSIWSIGPMNGPVFGPILGGFVTQYASWRWAAWVIMIWGAVATAMISCMGETYAPALLQKKAKQLRKEEGENRYWSRYDVRVSFWQLMRTNLSRPFQMAVKEPICIFWNVYIGVIYGILYLCFVAYPIVYTEQRGWTISQSSLAFLGIGVGNMITLCSATPIKRMIDAHKPDASGRVPPEAMMSVVCIAAVLIPIGELWFAWTCLPERIHPAISIAAGIPFGCGNGAVFIYATNYLVHSYGIYAASALAGNAVIRSFTGGVLPLAGPPLYRALGANWAGTLLGLLEVAIIPIPFVFYRYGHKIREKSSLIREMREIEDKHDAKKKRAEEKQQRQEAKIQGKGVEKSQHTTLSEKEVEAESELARVEGLTKSKEEV